jgi:hypothetical protein
MNALANPRQFLRNTDTASPKDERLRAFQQGRLLGMRTNRYSWWTHARELADFILPRRYKWLITQNQQNRGSPINQHILDSTGTLSARNLAAGIFSGVCPPTRPWIRYKWGKIDSTQSGPIPIWLKQCEDLTYAVLAASGFYTAMAVFLFDLVVFGTAALLIYEDFDNVISCINPCFGEYYVDIDGKYRPVIFYREFTYTISQCVDEFGWENCSSMIQNAYDNASGAYLTREVIIAHAIEPNTEPEKYGIPANFKYRETFWEWGGTTTPQGGTISKGFLRKRGFTERAAIVGRWDLVANDPYGRSPGMDALPDIKQLQQETRRKAQGIDKGINPPLVADAQLKNQPASLLPGGITFLQGLMTTGNDGMKPTYGSWKPDIVAITADIALVQARIKDTFFNNLFQVASQFETRSNITAVEWDMRKSESLVMLGPVLDRLRFEVLSPIIDRVWGIMNRANIIPTPPGEVAGQNVDVEFVSILQTSQQAAMAGSIERMLQMASTMAGIDPAVTDNIDFDMAFDIYAKMLATDPRIIRAPAQLTAIRKQRAQQQAQQQQLQSAETLAKAGANASNIDVGGGQNLVQRALQG